jgi:hypothetical protein
MDLPRANYVMMIEMILALRSLEQYSMNSFNVRLPHEY